MAPSRWWPFKQISQPEPPAERRDQEESSHKLRHDFLTHVNALALKTEEARRKLDEMDVRLQYLKATAGEG